MYGYKFWLIASLFVSACLIWPLALGWLTLFILATMLVLCILCEVLGRVFTEVAHAPGFKRFIIWSIGGFAILALQAFVLVHLPEYPKAFVFYEVAAFDGLMAWLYFSKMFNRLDCLMNGYTSIVRS